MDFSQMRDLLGQIQAGAGISASVGEPVQVGERVVIPVVEVAYAAGGGGGGGKSTEAGEGGGGGGGGAVRVHPLGCWVISPDDERWVPAVDVNRCIIVCGSIAALMLITFRKLMKHHKCR